MTFAIKRLSTRYEATPPCEGCQKHVVEAGDEYDEGEFYWTVELHTLEHIMRLMAEHGKLVFLPVGQATTNLSDTIAELPAIEIYDSWRE